MTLLLKIAFWISITLVFYSYIGYAFIIWAYLKIKPSPKLSVPTDQPLMPVTLIVACYNEAGILEKKVRNCLALDYPMDKLSFIFITDGSTDQSPEILARHPEIEHLHQSLRTGKVAAINRAMGHVKTEFVIFCDANTLLNSLSVQHIMNHYYNASVGAVAGEKKVEDLLDDTGASGAGEGIYWKYESFLKKLDSQFYSVVGAAGELFSIRTALYEHVEEDVLLDDFIISMRICRRGYKVIYEPLAFATEPPSFTMKEEQKRKIRISAGGFQSIKMLSDLLNIFKYGRLSFLYISHRVFRWTICPILLPLIFIINLILWKIFPESFFSVSFFAQVIFYLAAIIGWGFASKNIKIKSLYVPYYFVFMNAAMFIGFRKFYNKNQSVLWEKARRKI